VDIIIYKMKTYIHTLLYISKCKLYCMTYEKVTGNGSDFDAEWEAKKKNNASLHKKAISKIKNMCVFAKEKITGQ